MNTALNIEDKPTIHGTHVVLRPFTRDDADAMYTAALDPETTRLTGTHATFTREQIAEWCELIATAEGRVDLAIVSRAEGEFLGEVVLNDIDANNSSAGFRIALAGERHFGKGFGSEAAEMMVRYGFEVLGLNRISLEVFSFNARALRLYQKLGFKQEGRLREALRYDGQYHDAFVMGLLRREFLPER